VSQLTYRDDKTIAVWVKDKLDQENEIDFEKYTAIGVETDKHKLIAGLVFHDFRRKQRTISITMAATNPMWATHKNLKDLLGYPFLQLNVFKIWIATRFENKHALKTFKHIGFTQEAVLAHQFGPKKHCVMQRMLKNDYLKKYGDKDEKFST
jgi:RimJ/RimL family protein N-acetyltransferase